MILTHNGISCIMGATQSIISIFMIYPGSQFIHSEPRRCTPKTPRYPRQSCLSSTLEVKWVSNKIPKENFPKENVSISCVLSWIGKEKRNTVGITNQWYMYRNRFNLASQELSINLILWSLTRDRKASLSWALPAHQYTPPGLSSVLSQNISLATMKRLPVLLRKKKVG